VDKPKGVQSLKLKGIVHFKINFWYILAYLKGIQDVAVFVSAKFQFCFVMQVLKTQNERAVCVRK